MSSGQPPINCIFTHPNEFHNYQSRLSITICSWERTNSTTDGDGEALSTYYEIH
ncbi:hypothetical protein [Oceanobacillus alkalisoli]|uniref:hypothetical protein n=1 Tax=Oceanobacillus alkalisoli TaxID=2925113 RepID=UPI001EEFEA3F|nr:hypothetical protein [Oceanobacillus alkalisoli]MCF3943171.1 hypothetical protein [Oceanobacillus alkalisoli]MCG5105354.1 hypothetical protein [Oceanobacillus alkalisoli]